MNSKGLAVLMTSFEIIVVAGVIFMLITAGKTYAESLTIQKINTAEDIRMMVNVLDGIPGDAIVEYPKNVSAFSFILRPESVIVFVKDEPEQKNAIRSFHLPKGYTAEGTLEQKSRLCLEKKSTKILLRECS